jgi:hypothetical protein
LVGGARARRGVSGMELGALLPPSGLIGWLLSTRVSPKASRDGALGIRFEGIARSGVGIFSIISRVHFRGKFWWWSSIGLRLLLLR